jgi:hypothetical protein
METLDTSYDRIFYLVKQLPRQQKIRLAKELEKESINIRLSSLLEAFYTDELSQNVIDEEVEAVRQSIYEHQQSANSGNI